MAAVAVPVVAAAAVDAAATEPSYLSSALR
jgi:hypothetical protein